jgi:hypothetical protein
MPQVLESLRKRFREIPGIAVYMQPVQNLRLGGRQSKARFQYTLQSVNAGTMGVWADKLMERMRADPVFRDVTSDSQNRGLQATLDIDRDKAGVLGVAVGDLRTALYNAYGDRQIGSIYGASNTYQVILSAADSDRQFEEDMSRLSVRNKAGQLVPLSAFSTVKRTVGPTSVNHQGQLQAVTVSFNLAPDVPLGNATAKIDQFKAGEDSALDHHQLRRRCGCVQIRKAARRCCSSGGAGNRAAGRALQSCPSTHHHGRPALGSGGHAAVAQAFRLRPDADRDHQHPAAHRHREEERDHDDRLRPRSAAHRRHKASRRHPPCCDSARFT